MYVGVVGLLRKVLFVGCFPHHQHEILKVPVACSFRRSTGSGPGKRRSVRSEYYVREERAIVFYKRARTC